MLCLFDDQKKLSRRKEGSRGGREHTASGGGDARKEVGEPAEQRTAGLGGTGRWRGQARPGHPVWGRTPSGHHSSGQRAHIAKQSKAKQRPEN